MIGGSLAISPCCSSSSSSSSSSSALLLDSSDVPVYSFRSSYCCSSKRLNSIISCNASSASSSSSSPKHHKVPKLEPFSRSKFERGVKDPPLIQQSEAQLADYCSTLEGEDSYNCWQAYFKLKDLEKESPKEEVERLIIEAGGVKSLIGCLHGVSAIHKASKNRASNQDAKTKSGGVVGERKIPLHVPDGLPKTAEEMEEDEKAMMPDSAFTRMLRLRGKHPAWYSPTPDHQTD